MSRIPLQTGFERLRSQLEPGMRDIDKARRKGDLRVWCDGNLLPLRYAQTNLVFAHEYHGQKWRCVVEPDGP